MIIYYIFLLGILFYFHNVATYRVNLQQLRLFQKHRVFVIHKTLKSGSVGRKSIHYVSPFPVTAELWLHNDPKDEKFGLRWKKRWKWGFPLLKELPVRKLSSHQVVARDRYRKGRTCCLVHSFLQKNQKHVYTYACVYLEKLSTTAYQLLQRERIAQSTHKSGH